MKTASEIYEEVSGRKRYLHLYGLLDKQACEVVMREYALEIIKEIMEAEAQYNLYSGVCVNAVASEWIEKVKNQIR